MFRLAKRIASGLLVGLLPLVVLAGPVDVNTADAATLARELSGVGETTARAIVAYREANGPFESVEELRNVKGIGAKVLDRNRANILVGAPVETAE